MSRSIKQSIVFRTISICLLAIFYAVPAFCQNIQFNWGVSLGGFSNDVALSITTDEQGNIFTTGYINQTVDMDPGIGSFILVSNGSSDSYLTKMDPNGNFLWAVSVGAGSHDRGHSVVTDDLGNAYVIGRFFSTIDIDPGPDSLLFMSNGGHDIFIQKINSDGMLVWAAQFGGASLDIGEDVVVDAFGNVYSTGSYTISADFDPGPGVFDLIADSSGENAFISKLDGNGDFVWAKKLAGLFSTGFAIKHDDNGNLFIVGSFYGTVDFDPGVGVHPLTSNGNADIFILKLDTDGEFVWVRNIGGAEADWYVEAVIDNNGDIVTTGVFSDVADLDPGPNSFNLTSNGMDDVFIQKMDTDGNFLWAKGFGGSENDAGRAVDIDVGGNIYITGVYRDVVDLDPGIGVFNMIAEGEEDIFIEILDTDGNFLFANSIGGLEEEYCGSIHVDDFGKLYIAGYFKGSVDTDPGSGSTILTSNGITDVVIVQFETLVSGLSDLESSNLIKTYPNPNMGQMTIDLGSLTNVSIRVYDGSSRMVYEKDQISDKLQHLNLNVPSGSYIIEIVSDQGLSTQTVIVK